MDIKSTLLHLSLIKDIGPATIEKLVQTVSFFTLKNIYDLSIQDLTSLSNLPISKTKLIVDGLKNKKLLEDELNIISKNSIEYLCVYDSDYPDILKNSHLPPTIIYTVGKKLEKIEKAIAVVGSRKADDYGQTIINSIVPELVANKWCIVSGGALGIDSMAHDITINHGGRTISVLGSGLLKPYPNTNKSLFRKIIDNNGTIVSPFPLKMNALAGNFPARNRIISGLSQACLVVQAADKSGALITAQYALEQGKEVCAVPGPIDNELSVGCHKLIAQGAAIITNANDIFNILNEIPVIQLSNKKLTPSDQPTSISQSPKVENSLNTQLLNLCSTPKSFDEILATLLLESNQLQDTLFDMQLDNIIKQDISGFWIKNI